MRPGLLTVTSSVALVRCLWTLIRVIRRLTIVTRRDAVVEMPRLLVTVTLTVYVPTWR